MEIKTLTIVIPAFNEALRLQQTLVNLKNYALPLPNSLPLRLREVIVVDDGSKDETVTLVTRMLAQWPELKILSLSQNQGKGAALRAGVLASQSDWVLMADADESTPWNQLEPLFRAVQSTGLEGAIASRAHLQSQIRVRQSWWREHMGKTFNHLLRALTGLRFRDTQCGFKLFRNTSALQKIFRELQTRRFAYDVEVLLRLERAGLRVQEVPVIWEHKDDSRVHLVFDSLEMLFSVLKLRWKLMLRNR